MNTGENAYDHVPDHVNVGQNDDYLIGNLLARE
jgi:hypothetical protein